MRDKAFAVVLIIIGLAIGYLVGHEFGRRAGEELFTGTLIEKPAEGQIYRTVLVCYLKTETQPGPVSPFRYYHFGSDTPFGVKVEAGKTFIYTDGKFRPVEIK